MSNNIHITAVVSKSAVLGDNLTIGPYCIVGDNVTLKDGVELKSHVVIDGHTTIGENTILFPFSAVGLAPQDKKYAGEPSQLIIGKNNTIREYVTVNPGTEGGGMLTSIGDNCLFMVGAHIAHDCKIGNDVIMANNATLAGHVEIEDFAILGGLCAVRQFVRIGTHAMIGGMAAIESDVIPYGVAMNERASLAGINIIGLKRRGFDRDSINLIKNAYNILFAAHETMTFAERIEQIEVEFGDNPAVLQIVNFLKSDSSRAICKPKNLL